MSVSTTNRSELIATIQGLHQRGWCDGTGGNFSVVDQTNPLVLMMAPSGVDKGQVRDQDIIKINADGHVVYGEGQASAETPLHLMIIKQTDAGAVLHTHSPVGTVLSRHYEQNGFIHFEGWEMLKGLRGINTHETKVELPIVANDQDTNRLAEAIRPLLVRAPNGLLVSGHGLYSWGRNIAEARRHVEIIEFLLDLSWKQHLLSIGK